MKYWVSYHQYRGSGCEGTSHAVISEHPLLWESNHADNGTMNGGPSLIDWKEIPDEVANKLSQSSKP